jgi:hypothetical protein
MIESGLKSTTTLLLVAMAASLAAWACTRQAMDHWAEGLRKALGRWHGNPPPEK